MNRFQPAKTGLIGVDWGSTNRRGYRLAADGSCVAEQADGEGMLAAKGRFEESLEGLLETLGVEDPDTPVVLSGMVGSASGWVEAPYLDVRVPLPALHQHLLRVPHTSRPCFIVPGYRVQTGGRIDVMRGEETQLLGAVAQGLRDGWFMLPGTHNKWVRMQAGAMVEFATYMTGELFSLLSRQGTLAAACEGEVPAHDAFVAGLQASADGVLSNTLFGCRARVVSGAMAASDAYSYLSGLLIGSEWRDAERRNNGVLPSRLTAIGTTDLVRRYVAAGEEFGVTVDVLDPRATYLAALAALCTGS